MYWRQTMNWNPKTVRYQRLFDFIVEAIRNQGGQSLLLNGPSACRYRGKGGRKCAAGHLIPDDKYNEKIECANVAIGTHPYSLFLSMGYPDTKIRFIRAMQLVHDNGTSESNMESGFARVAEQYKLKYTKKEGWWKNG